MKKILALIILLASFSSFASSESTLTIKSIQSGKATSNGSYPSFASSVCALTVTSDGRFPRFIVRQDSAEIYATNSLEFAKEYLDNKVVLGECADTDFSQLPHCYLDETSEVNYISIKVGETKSTSFHRIHRGSIDHILKTYLQARLCKRSNL